jgi:hypothetical protein
MNKDHSRILIMDQIMQHPAPTASSVLYDIYMLTLFGGKERTVAEVVSLIKKADAGLRVCSIKRSPDSFNTIVELAL